MSHIDVQKTLDQLRDSPLENAPEAILKQIFDYLMSVSNGETIHWFCGEASSTTTAAAAFALRLHAYAEGENVRLWKLKMAKCLSGCLRCIHELEGAKFISRNTFLSAFPEDLRNKFDDSFEETEANNVIGDPKLRGLPLLGQPSSKTLADVPLLAYRMVSSFGVFQHPTIQSLIDRYPPLEPLAWPLEFLPAGMLILLLHRNTRVRNWALGQVKKCTTVPLPNEGFRGPYSRALKVIDTVLSSYSSIAPSGAETYSAIREYIVSDPALLWSSLIEPLKLIPPDSLISGQFQHVDLRRTVCGHLVDTGPELPAIIKCMELLHKRLQAKFWLGEGPEFPPHTFDCIKDNPSFIDHIRERRGDKRTVIWFYEYILWISDPQVHQEVVLKMLDFLCGFLQHERFVDCRTSMMEFAASLLNSVQDKYPKVAAVGFRIHAQVFTSVAFSSAYSDSRWQGARATSRKLILNVLLSDITAIAVASDILCKAEGSQGIPPFPILQITEHVWTSVYDSLKAESGDGLAMVINAMSKAAHLDFIHTPAYGKLSNSPVLSKLAKDIRPALICVRSGFLDAVKFFAQRNASTDATAILRDPNVVKQLLKLMFSLAEDMREAARIFLGLAFDADLQSDCFEALLIRYPTQSMEGLLDILDNFITYANTVPEACNLSKSLVRGFTIVMEVLCSPPDGLLYNSSWIRASDPTSPALQLPTLWEKMTKMLALIFKRVPIWAQFFENEEMLNWMRDVLIFGSGILGDLRAFRSTVKGLNITADRARQMDRAMLNDMQQVFTDLARWLRLTDEELLHQSFLLLESLFAVFHDNKIDPNKDGLNRLHRLLEMADEADPNVRGTRLDGAKIQRLRVLLQPVDVVEDETIVISDDEDIQEISVPTKQKKERKDEKAAKKEKEKEKRERKESRKAEKLVARPPKPTIAKTHQAFFSDKDRLRLEAAVPSAKFRRSSAASSSKVPPTGPRSDQPSTTATSVEPSGTSSESDSDKEDQRTALQRLADKTLKIKPPQLPRRQIKTIDVATTAAINIARNREQYEREKAREAAASRASKRSKPNFTNLYRTTCSWNYDHNSNKPPGRLYTLRVPDRFKDVHHYLKVFEPLLFHELWAQIHNNKDDVNVSFECLIHTKTSSDSGTDMDIAITGPIPADWRISDSDLVLLRNKERSRSTMARVVSSVANRTSGAISATIQCYFDENNPDPGLQLNSKWQLSKVYNMSTVLREYAALITLPYYEYLDVILNPRIAMPPPLDPSVVRRTMDTYQLNEPQAKAIESAMATEGFVLIQGPPGTGKTSTICGLVTAATTRRPKRIPTPGNQNQNHNPPPKVLVCAPSNAAIDEIAFRLKEGYRGSVKTNDPLKVVRMGSRAKIGDNVMDIYFDRLVEDSVGVGNQMDAKERDMQISALIRDMQASKERSERLLQEKESTHDNVARVASLTGDIANERARRSQIASKLDAVRAQKTQANRASDTMRRAAEARVLGNAEVICTTLSAAGHTLLQLQGLEFDVVIIDEAAQAIELSTLVPLKFPCKRCILVGDPNQLPPTVTSSEASKLLYNQSLFVRLQKDCPQAVHLLSIQYRMHPEISALPSKLFYKSELKDGPDMAKKTAKPWHGDAKFGVYKLFNVSGNQEKTPSQSWKNLAEAQVVLALYSRLRTAHGKDATIGIISPYKGQVFELKTIFHRRYGHEILDSVTFNTVDGFQGQEKDIIILSTVRAGPGVQTIGFLDDVRRMNVAMTRAKSGLFVIGNMPTLERSDDIWKSIVADGRQRELCVTITTSYFTQSSLGGPPTPIKKAATKVSSSTALPPPPVGLSTPKALAQSTGGGSRPSGSKRKLEDDDAEKPEVKRPAKASPAKPPAAHGLPPKPSTDKQQRPQLPTRPSKKKEMTMFIPSKKNQNLNNRKRPPDRDEDGPGPSNRPKIS